MARVYDAVFIRTYSSLYFLVLQVNHEYELFLRKDFQEISDLRIRKRY